METLDKLQKLVNKARLSEALGSRIDALKLSKERVSAKAKQGDLEEEDVWEGPIPIAIAEKVIDMMIEHYANLQKELMEELANLEIIYKKK